VGALTQCVSIMINSIGIQIILSERLKAKNPLLHLDITFNFPSDVIAKHFVLIEFHTNMKENQ
jgi:hypothetical protein